ncbi:MAG TPA: hypothetical protein VL199_12140 [Burkholderiales bacterium]|jgi:hypothetical protein|nr:hypothetical protein [Burkholderiales bacterium]
MRKDKAAALIALAAISFVMPALERAMTGRVEMLSTYGLVETALSLIALFWWFHLDKAEQNYRAGKLMNAGVLILAAVALPIYFLRSRGWKRGGIAIVWAIVFLGVMFVLETAGEWLGGYLHL